MPTTYTDQFFVLDPYAPPPAGTFIPVVTFDLIDQNNDGDIDSFDNDSVDGSDVTQSYPGDTVTINVAGVGLVTYTGITFYLADGRQVFTPTDGQVLQEGTLDSASAVNTQGPLDVNDLGPPCFVGGTMIDTPVGPRPVETLRVGDQVMTLDHGVQRVRWVGQREVSGTGDFAPIRFATGTIGNDAPLLVSPQHRVMLSGWKAQMLFGTREVLVAAKHLIDGRAVRVQPMRRVRYHHFLCDTHELVWSNGGLTESFFPGDTICDEDQDLMAELEALFPELIRERDCGEVETARIVLKRHEARVLQAA